MKVVSIKNRKAEFGFVWFFAIIAGIAILFLSIYGATRIGQTIEVEGEATVAKKLTILTDPLEAGFTSATFGTITFQRETEIRNECDPFDFGSVSLSARTKSDVNTGNSKFSVPVTSKEKYIFSKDVDSGETYYVLSQAFNFPFKIADFVILISDSNDYCFVDAPEDVFEELSALKIPSISFENCSTDSEKVQVCFGGLDCDVSVIGSCEGCQNFYDSGTVRKNGFESDYVGNLLYPAIFSDEFNYECNIDRLLYRGSLVASVLTRKADLMNARNCNTNLRPVLATWSGLLQNASSSEITSLHSVALEMEEAAKWEVCSVW